MYSLNKYDCTFLNINKNIINLSTFFYLLEIILFLKGNNIIHLIKAFNQKYSLNNNY